MSAARWLFSILSFLDEEFLTHTQILRQITTQVATMERPPLPAELAAAASELAPADDSAGGAACVAEK